MAKYPIPITDGFYWAKWRICNDNTYANEDEFEPRDCWEPVEVFVNHHNDEAPERLMVSVIGVTAGQALENFVWGPRIPEFKDQPFAGGLRETKR